MPTQEELIKQISENVTHIMNEQDIMKSEQNKMKLILHDVKIDLCGTKADPERGLVPRLRQAERCISSIKKKQYKIVVWSVVIVTSVSVLFEAIRLFITLKHGG